MVVIPRDLNQFLNIIACLKALMFMFKISIVCVFDIFCFLRYYIFCQGLCLIIEHTLYIYIFIGRPLTQLLFIIHNVPHCLKLPLYPNTCHKPTVINNTWIYDKITQFDTYLTQFDIYLTQIFQCKINGDFDNFTLNNIILYSAIVLT